MTLPASAREALAQELGDRRPADLTIASQALQAAEELLADSSCREEWAAPADDWEHLVVAAALATLRVEGACRVTRKGALAAVRDALAELAQGRAA